MTHSEASCFVGLLEGRPSARIIRETWRELKQNKRLNIHFQHGKSAWELWEHRQCAGAVENDSQKHAIEEHLCREERRSCVWREKRRLSPDSPDRFECISRLCNYSEFELLLPLHWLSMFALKYWVPGAGWCVHDDGQVNIVEWKKGGRKKGFIFNKFAIIAVNFSTRRRVNFYAVSLLDSRVLTL